MLIKHRYRQFNAGNMYVQFTPWNHKVEEWRIFPYFLDFAGGAERE